MKQLISNEQIINVLKTWAVDNVEIQEDRYITIWFINNTREYKVKASVDGYNSPQKYRMVSIQKKTNECYKTIYIIDSAFSDIAIDFDYLINIKANEYVKKNVDNMLSTEPLNGFDALVE